MPLFDYLCQDCGKTSEFLITGEKYKLKCSSCGSVKLKKMLSAHASISGVASPSLRCDMDGAGCETNPGQCGCAEAGGCSKMN